ncbi:hypothetical protein [Colwellia sp. MEBiC06753]
MESKIIKELITANQELSHQLNTQSQIIFGLLKVLPPEYINTLQLMLQTQADSDIGNEQVNASCHSALALVKMLNKDKSHQKSEFEVIDGGKHD